MTDGSAATVSMVGIVLLNWNGWRDTVSCLDSLKKLSYGSYQVVVVDNASGDDSVVQIKAAHPEIDLIVNDQNLGFGGGCNIGIQWALSKGVDLIWLLNNDTVVEAETLTALVQCLHRDPHCVAAGSVLYYMHDRERIQAWGGGAISFWLGTSRHFDSRPPTGQIDYLTAASLLISASALQAVGLFDSDRFFMYWEDVDLSFRLRKNGGVLAVAEDSRVWHKESASLGKRSPKLAYYFGQSALAFFSKHTKYAIVPIAVGTSGRLIKALFRRDVNSFKSIIKSFY